MIRQGDKIVNIRTGQEMTFLKTGKETAGKLLQIECFSPASEIQEPVHIHPQQINRFTIVSGKLNFWIDGAERTMHAGETISIPPNVPHHFWNTTKEGTRYIQEFLPAGNIDELFRSFFALARDKKLNKNGIPNLLHASMIMLAHEKDIRLSKPSWILQKITYSLLAPIGYLLGYRGRYK